MPDEMPDELAGGKVWPASMERLREQLTATPPPGPSVSYCAAVSGSSGVIQGRFAQMPANASVLLPTAQPNTVPTSIADSMSALPSLPASTAVAILDLPDLPPAQSHMLSFYGSAAPAGASHLPDPRTLFVGQGVLSSALSQTLGHQLPAQQPPAIGLQQFMTTAPSLNGAHALTGAIAHPTLPFANGKTWTSA